MPSSVRTKTLWLIPCFAIVGSAFVFSNVEAKKGGQNVQMSLNKTQQQQLFETRKDLELSNVGSRIAIINDSKNCINASNTPGALRNCRQIRRQSHRALKEQNRKEINATLKSIGLDPIPLHHKHGHRQCLNQV
ncbi:MAG TPA: hypothetical protein ACN46R_01130 [Prochlorococcus sp.]